MLGGPGAGKTVQSAYAAQAMNLFHVSAGGLLRAFVKEGADDAEFVSPGATVDSTQWSKWREEFLLYCTPP